MSVRRGVRGGKCIGPPSLKDRVIHRILILVKGNKFHPLVVLLGAGGGEALSVASGIAAMGAGEAGVVVVGGKVGSGTGCGEVSVGMAWTGEARAVVGEAEGVGCVEGPALLVVALPRTDKTPASLAPLSSVITMPAPKKKN